MWRCTATTHAHRGDLTFLGGVIGGALPSRTACEWCVCPQLTEIPPEPPFVHSPGTGFGPDPVQEGLQIEFLRQEANDRGR